MNTAARRNRVALLFVKVCFEFLSAVIFPCCPLAAYLFLGRLLVVVIDLDPEGSRQVQNLLDVFAFLADDFACMRQTNVVGLNNMRISRDDVTNKNELPRECREAHLPTIFLGT